MSESCKVCGAQFQEPLSLIAHLTSHGPRLDSGLLAAEFPPLDGARWRLPACAELRRSEDGVPPPEEQETASRSSPLNLTGPRLPQRHPASDVGSYTSDCSLSQPGVGYVAEDLSAGYTAVEYGHCYSGPGTDGPGFQPAAAGFCDQPLTGYVPPLGGFSHCVPGETAELSHQVVDFSAPFAGEPPPAPEPVRPYRCSLCAETFADKPELRAHVDSHSADKVCICHVCGIRLSSKWSVRRHMMVHAPESKPFSCEVCDRRFAQKHDLSRHQLLHQRCPLRCERCGRVFAAAHHMSAHKCSARPPRPRRRRGDNQLPCRLCPLTCSTAAAWGFHMWRHTKDARYLPDFSAAPPADAAQQRAGQGALPGGPQGGSGETAAASDAAWTAESVGVDRPAGAVCEGAVPPVLPPAAPLLCGV